MVLLTMTPSMVEALEKVQSLEIGTDERRQPPASEATPDQSSRIKDDETVTTVGKNENAGILAEERDQNSSNSTSGDIKAAGEGPKSTESSLENPKVGNPISHGQVIDLSKQLKALGMQPCNLDILLRGSWIHVPPPPPKLEPTSEYKALMARLRREEEARSYERMINPLLPMETFTQRFPLSSAVHAFSSNHELTASEEDEVTYADVDRQMTLILNVLISIVACAGAIWVAAKWWSTPARLALSMGGSILVGVAEVVVYSGYITRVGEAKEKEKSVTEIKEVMKTWVVGGEDDENSGRAKLSVKIKAKEDPGDVKARRRKRETT